MIKSIKILLVAVLCLATACHRRPLEDPNNLVKFMVKLKVNQIKNISIDVYNDRIPLPSVDPDMVRVLFYNQNTEELISESYISTKTEMINGDKYISGQVMITPGSYKMLCYNFDTASTVVTDYRNFNSVIAHSSDIPASLYEYFMQEAINNQTRVDDEGIIYEPDHLLVARDERLNIEPHTDEYTIYADAWSVVQTYYLQIKVQGLQYVSGATAVLSGMSAASKIAYDEPQTDKPVSVYFNLQKSEDNGADVLCAVFNTFGKIPLIDSSLNVTFDLKTSDGRVVNKTYDISNLFKTENAINHRWLLMDEVLVIDPPAGGNSGGGFQPEVGDWDDEHGDINM